MATVQIGQKAALTDGAVTNKSPTAKYFSFINEFYFTLVCSGCKNYFLFPSSFLSLCSVSFFFIFSLLSYFFKPLPRPISTFANPFLR